MAKLRKENGAYMKVTLPVPPSVNAMYRRSRGFGLYKTPEAKAWIVESLYILRKNRHRFTGKVEVAIYFFFARENDIDNRIKALLDLLAAAEVYENDSQVYGLLVMKDFDKKNPRVEVRITEL